MRERTSQFLRWTCLAALLLATASLTTGTAAAEDFAVIVHQSNNYADSVEAMKQVVRQLFLKERSEWPNKIAVKPFARAAGSSEHDAFLNGVLKMTEADLANHWISLKQRTGQTAPREISRDSLLIKLVAKYEGSFAVVSKGEAEGSDSVRVLFTFAH